MTNHDRWGHDIITGKRLYEERVVDGKLQRLPTPELTHATYLLDDGSLMRVCISKESKSNLKGDTKELDSIMKKVVAGWKVECKEKVDRKEWTKDKADKYVNEYEKKTIFDRIDDIPYKALANVDQEVAKVKKRMLKQIRKDKR